MNWLKRTLIFSALTALAGCGVKGDPLPPEKPPTLGRGRPTYKRATEEIQVKKHSAPNPSGKTSEDEDDKE